MPRRRGSLFRTLIFGSVAVLVVVAFLARRTGMIPDREPAFDPEGYRDVPALAPEEAGGHVGERAVVCGQVVNAVFARGTSGQPTFLNLERAYPDQPFDVVIWGRDRDRFHAPPEAFYRNMRVCAAGRITEHQGVPRIEARTSDQLRLHEW